MINYGKIAYKKVDELYKNKHNFDCKFLSKGLQYNLTSQNNYFLLNIESDGIVYFNLKTNAKTNCKVYIDSLLQYYKYNFDFATFSIKIDGKQTLKFEFEINADLECDVMILGNASISKDNIIFVSNNLNFKMISQLDQEFRVYSGDSLSSSISNFNNDVYKVYDGRCLNASTNGSILYVKDDVPYIFGADRTILSIRNLQLENGCIFEPNLVGTPYMILTFEKEEFRFIFVNYVGDIAKIISKNISEINLNLKRIDNVLNIADNKLYFVVTDNNNYNYILLCKIEENGLNITFSSLVYLGKSEKVSVTKTTSNNFLVSQKCDDGFKVVDLNINFDNGVATSEYSRKFNNVSDICLIDAETVILRFDNSVVSVNLN